MVKVATTGSYAKGLTVSDAQMQALNLEEAEVCPQWNYTIRPQSLQ